MLWEASNVACHPHKHSGCPLQHKPARVTWPSLLVFVGMSYVPMDHIYWTRVLVNMDKA